MTPRSRHVAIALGMLTAVSAEVFLGFRAAEEAEVGHGWIAVGTATAVAVTLGASLLLFRSSVRQGRLEAEKLTALELERSARLVELGRLAAGVAHEIHNPLQGVHGYLLLLERAADDPVKRGAHIEAIRGALSRIERLTRDLLDFAQPRIEHRVALAPYELFATFRRTLEADPRFAGIECTVDVASGVPSVFVEPAAIERILLNLALNACQAMEGKGSLTLAARRGAPGYVDLEVADSGPGVAKDLRGRLFEPFQSGRGSTGLGLWICANLARAHGGSIRHESGFRPGDAAGSRFVVTLPDYAP